MRFFPLTRCLLWSLTEGIRTVTQSLVVGGPLLPPHSELHHDGPGQRAAGEKPELLSLDLLLGV